MAGGVRCAGSESWWLWQGEAIREGARRTRHLYWKAMVLTALAQNRRQGRFPKTKEELAGALDRDVGSVSDLLAGRRSLTDQTLLGLAAIFDLPTSSFTPPPHVWICGMTLSLCGPAVTQEEAMCYAVYRLNQELRPEADSTDDLDGIALDRVVRDNRTSIKDRKRVEVALEKVVRVLGRRLEEVCPHQVAS